MHDIRKHSMTFLVITLKNLQVLNVQLDDYVKKH